MSEFVISESTDWINDYQKMINYYHSVPKEIALFMEKVLLNLIFLVKNQKLTPAKESDLNEYFKRLKDVHLSHYKEKEKVRVRVLIKHKSSWKKLFNIGIKNVQELIDLKLYINGYEFDYKDLLLQFKIS
jgi:hypothetical protein